MLLHPVPHHHEGESPTSFLSRAARLNGVRARELCDHMRLSFRGIVDGCNDAIARLADLTGATFSKLMGEAIVRTAEGFELRGQSLLKTSLQRNAFRVCPICLRDDLKAADGPADCAVFGRTLWTLRGIRRCHLHNVNLVPIAVAGTSGRLHDFAACVGPMVDQVEELTFRAEQWSASAMEVYLLSRLSGSAGSIPFLDDLSWHSVESICESLGAVALFGRDVPFAQLDENQWAMSGDAGFVIASGGETDIKDLLGYFDTSYAKARASTEGPQALYGSLHRRLHATHREETFAKLREIITNHVLHTYAVGPKDIIYGKPFTTRALHSIRSASLEYGIHPIRLRKVLLAQGLIDSADETDERSVFNAAAADPLLRRIATSASLTEAETYLNAGRVQTKLLFDAGFIKPVLVLPAVKNTEYIFATADLDAFLATLLGRATEVEADDDLADLPSAAKRSCCSAADIVRMILEGELSVIGRQKGQSGYLAVRVSLHEVKAKVRGVRAAGFTARDLEKALGTTTKVVSALIKRGHFTPQQHVNPVNRCPLYLIDHGEVAAFREEYVSLHSLAKERGRHFLKVREELDRAAIHPALSREDYGASFYRRSDLQV